MVLDNTIFGHLQLLSYKLDTLIQATQGAMLHGHYQRSYLNHDPYNYSNQDGFLFSKPQHQGYMVNHQGQRDFPHMEYFNNQGLISQNQGGPSNPPPLDDENSLMIKQIIEGQNRFDSELSNNMEKISNKVEVVIDDLNVKFESLRYRAMELEKKLAQWNSSSKSHEQEHFMGTHESYPNDYCNVIEEEEGYEKECFLFDVDESTMELQRHFGNGVREDCVKEHVERVLSGDLVEDTCEKVLIVACTQEAKESSKVAELSSKDGELMGKERDHKTKNTTTKMNLNLEVPPYVPPLPFPGRFKRVKHEEILRKNGILPPHKEEKKLPKLKNPGKFMVPCLLEKIHEEEALVDTGASVNVISLDIIRKYGIKDSIKPTSPIALCDSSIKQPIGKLEDYHLKIGDCIIPTDFVIVKMKSQSKFPLVLGNPFLETVGTKIDFITKEVILANIDPDKSYKMVKAYGGFCGTVDANEREDSLVDELDLSDSFEWLFERDGNEEVSKEVLLGMVKKTKKHHGKKNKSKQQPMVDEEFLDGHSLSHLFSNHVSKATNGKTPFRTREEPMMTFIPIGYKDGVVEYKIKCKGISKPFSRARSVISKEVMEEEPKRIKEIMQKILRFELVDKGAKSLGGSHSTTH